MHLYTAITTAAPGHVRQARESVVKLRDAAIGAHGVPTSAWAIVAGAPFGTYAISARLDDSTQLLEGMAALDASSEWNDVAESTAGHFAGSAETTYAQVVAATTDGLPTKPIVSATRARIAPGKVREGVEAAVGLLNHACESNGLDGALTMSVAGSMNELTWLIGLDSAAQGDETLAKLAADPKWLELEDTSGACFQPGAERMLLVRLP